VLKLATKASPFQFMNIYYEGTPSACLTDEVSPKQLLQKLSIEPLTFKQDICSLRVRQTSVNILIILRAVRPRNRNSIPRMDNRFFSSPQRPEWLRRPHKHQGLILLRITRPAPTDNHWHLHSDQQCVVPPTSTPSHIVVS
jgi:hypothetical protein